MLICDNGLEESLFWLAERGWELALISAVVKFVYALTFGALPLCEILFTPRSSCEPGNHVDLNVYSVAGFWPG